MPTPAALCLLRFLCLLLLGLLFTSRVAYSQSELAAYQRLPVINRIPHGPVEADTATGTVRALKQRLYPDISRIITARRGWFAAEKDTLPLAGYRLYRADAQPCGYRLLVLQGIMDAFLLTTTPDFTVVDAQQVWNWEPVGWQLGKQKGQKGLANAQGYASELTGYIADCAHFKTTTTARRFYRNGAKPTVLSQRSSAYQIAPSGLIKPAVIAK